jgi:cell division protein FtsW (lipid II flippase)
VALDDFALIAAILFSVLAAATACFHLALALGAPWGTLTWGGRFPGRLPAAMRAVAVVSAGLLLAFGVVVSSRAGVALAEWQVLSRKLVWIVVTYCALGVVANTITPSRWERVLWLPVVLAMLVCSVVVAAGG